MDVEKIWEVLSRCAQLPRPCLIWLSVLKDERQKSQDVLRIRCRSLQSRWGMSKQPLAVGTSSKEHQDKKKENRRCSSGPIIYIIKQ